MTKRFLIRPRAVRDIDDHAAYLSRNASMQVANRFLEKLAETLMRIWNTPEMGSPWESSKKELDGLRFRIPRRFKNHVIFYFETDESVEIVRVLQASRDLEKRLLEMDE